MQSLTPQSWNSQFSATFQAKGQALPPFCSWGKSHPSGRCLISWVGWEVLAVQRCLGVEHAYISGSLWLALLGMLGQDPAPSWVSSLGRQAIPRDTVGGGWVTTVKGRGAEKWSNLSWALCPPVILIKPGST